MTNECRKKSSHARYVRTLVSLRMHFLSQLSPRIEQPRKTIVSWQATVPYYFLADRPYFQAIRNHGQAMYRQAAKIPISMQQHLTSTPIATRLQQTSRESATWIAIAGPTIQNEFSGGKTRNNSRHTRLLQPSPRTAAP
jgi:hypothetical protein